MNIGMIFSRHTFGGLVLLDHRILFSKQGGAAFSTYYDLSSLVDIQARGQ